MFFKTGLIELYADYLARARTTVAMSVDMQNAEGMWACAEPTQQRAKHSICDKNIPVAPGVTLIDTSCVGLIMKSDTLRSSQVMTVNGPETEY